MNPDYNWPEKLREAIAFSETSLHFALSQKAHWDTELKRLSLLLENQNHWLEEAEKREEKQ